MLAVRVCKLAMSVEVGRESVQVGSESVQVGRECAGWQ